MLPNEQGFTCAETVTELLTPYHPDVYVDHSKEDMLVVLQKLAKIYVKKPTRSRRA